MNQILDLEQPGYPLKEDLRAQLDLMQQPVTHQICVDKARSILTDTFCQTDLDRVSWYSEKWLDNTIANALHTFDRACDRWRNLYDDAVNQKMEAQRIIGLFRNNYDAWWLKALRSKDLSHQVSKHIQLA